MEYQGLGRKKRSWFRRLIGKVSSYVPGTVGLALKAAIALNDLIFKLDKSFSSNEINPTMYEENQAENILKTKALPTINLIEANINSLLVGGKTIDEIISKLNIYLKQIATLQAWVRMNENSTNINVVDYMVSSILEPLLAALNKSINKVLRINNIKTKVTSTPTNFIASDIDTVLQLDINWQEVTSTTYQKLSEKVTNIDNTEVVIIPSVDNEDLSNVISEIQTDIEIPQKKDGFGKVLFGMGVLFVLY